MLKSLEASLEASIARVRASPAAGEREREALAEIARHVVGLDALDEGVKVARVRAILAVIDELTTPSEAALAQRSRDEAAAHDQARARTGRASSRDERPPDEGAKPKTRARSREQRAAEDPGDESAKTKARARSREQPAAENAGDRGAKTKALVRSREQRAVEAAGDEGTKPKARARQRGSRRAAAVEGAELEARADERDAESEAQPEPRAKRPSKRAARVEPRDATPQTPLDSIAGIGPKTAERLGDRGLRTVKDALLFLPRRYEDRRTFTRIADLQAGKYATLEGTVLAHAIRFAGPGRRFFELAVKEVAPPGSPARTLSCRWFRFQRSALEKRFARGQRVIVSGTPSEWGSMRQMVHPDVELLDENEDARPAGLVPVYAEIDGVPPKTLRKLLVELARAAALQLDDPLPHALRDRLRLPELGGAVLRAHDPAPENGTTTPALAPGSPLHRRLAFDELFFLQLALARRRQGRDEEPGLAHATPTSWRGLARTLLPFALTGAQERALDELACELASPQPMSRLLQGDVGAGKTAVALVAAAIVIEAGRQVALLAPTEILAAQHHATAVRLGAARNIRTALLTGSTRAKDRRAILDQLRSGELDLIVGTHALLEPDVELRALGLGIIDEQHRFGVEQRAALRAKAPAGSAPDMLVMTATPIPRTLALTLYGDLRVTVLDELPPGRQPTITRLLDGVRQRREVYASVDRALDAGRQAFIVYPLVEASEKTDLKAATEAAGELEARFAPRTVGLLHGRMRPEEKLATMERFIRGELAVLVSTTVIEVGVDVPNATMMVVEHAERFGLSQIHQLRGRVGRGAHRGECVLVTGAATPEALERLSVLAATSDGFKVAEHDLSTRGPGELLGTRQSGLPDLAFADLVRDAKILEEARDEAFRIIGDDPALEHAHHRALAAELARRFATGAGLAVVG